MGQCVSQGIILGGTIFKHPGINKTLNHIRPNTMTWPSWSPLNWWQLVHVMPVITSSSNCSHFSGHPASKPLSTWAGITAQNSREGGHHCQEPPATWSPCLAGLQRYFLPVIPLGNCFVFPAHLMCCHKQIKSQTIRSLFGFPELCIRTNSFFNCNWQSFCSSPCFQSWEQSKIRRKKSWLFFPKKKHW